MTKNKKRKLNVAHATKHEGTKPKAQPQKKQSSANQQQPTVPFEAEDRILLIGEGDFSFAKSIIEDHGCCDVTATCYDSTDELFEKYKPQADEHVKFLEDEGQTVLYGIDATKLDSYKALKKGAQFDRIIFNFPHVGGKSKDVNRQVRFNQELLVRFFTAALSLLASEGTIVVTLFEGEPYTLWNIRDLARHAGLEVQRSFKFLAAAYPSYSHSRTLGNIDGGGGWKGENREARSYVFQKKGVQQAAMGRKRGRDVDSSDDES
jgi:25S rRNA (uracil2634-N3)-methyltransferase